jgi:hypothetical protein
MDVARGWSPGADDLSAREIDLPAHWIASRIGRARQNLDRHPNYILAAYMASGT